MSVNLILFSHVFTRLCMLDQFVAAAIHGAIFIMVFKLCARIMHDSAVNAVLGGNLNRLKSSFKIHLISVAFTLIAYLFVIINEKHFKMKL